jgi:hypothetical protein
MDIISLLASKEFETIINIFFGSLWIPLGILALLSISKLLNQLKNKEEVSMVSFLLQPQETLKEIRIIFYGCSIFFIGSIFGLLSFLLAFQGLEPILIALSSVFHTFVMTLATAYAILMAYISFRWSRRFRKYG